MLSYSTAGMMFARLFSLGLVVFLCCPTISPTTQLFIDPIQLDVLEDDENYELTVISTDNHPYYKFNAFGNEITLELEPNGKLISPTMRTLIRNGDWGDEEVGGLPAECHFLHRGTDATAAISLCSGHHLRGFVFLKSLTIEVGPLRPHNSTSSGWTESIHVLKRAPPFAFEWDDEIRLTPLPRSVETQEAEIANNRSTRATGTAKLETAMFLDEAGYKLFAPYFDGKDDQLRDMLLAYMNGVQALYHHPSAGTRVDIAVVRLEIQKSQPQDLPHYRGERGPLLDSFCAYSEKTNPPKDTDPHHWDIGLYLSGLDFYAVENGRQSGVTMGLATVGGVCMPKYACVIAELGATNLLGKPYPSAGFTSVYVLAHEIGHNLGMHHDGHSNNCPKDGFIMSPSRGTVGETLWSTCSAEVLGKLSTWAKCLYDEPKVSEPGFDHSKYGDKPGEMWGAKRQCEVLLRDHDAHLQDPDKTEDICQNLKCRTPHRAGYYFSGPALEGTSCGANKWCQGGSCVAKKVKPSKVVKGGWSAWKNEKCISGCLMKSKGYQQRRRICDNPKPINTEEGCEGQSFDVILCKDEKVCKKSKRQTQAQYATKKCKEYSKLLSDLDSKGSGLQAPHEEERLWMACTIFCRRKDTGSYYTPRLELNDLGVDPYFPDGTWCHNDGKYNFYCLRHHCLPENFRMSKSIPWNEDVNLLQNAPPRLLPVSDLLLKYLSLDPEGRPLSKTFKPGSAQVPENEWDTKDYIELPKL